MGTVPTFTPALTQSDLQWWAASRPYAYMYQTSGVSVSTSTWTACSLQAHTVDRDSGHSGTSARYLIGNTIGTYRVSAHVAFPTIAGGGLVGARLVVNGTAVVSVQVPSSTADATSVVIPAFPVTSTLNTDYVELQAWQNSGSTVVTDVTGAHQSSMSVVFDGS